MPPFGSTPQRFRQYPFPHTQGGFAQANENKTMINNTFFVSCAAVALAMACGSASASTSALTGEHAKMSAYEGVRGVSEGVRGSSEGVRGVSGPTAEGVRAASVSV